MLTPPRRSTLFPYTTLFRSRSEALDEVVLEQQRLALGAGNRDLDRADLGEHHLDPRARRLLLEVRPDALLQVARLADVKRLDRKSTRLNSSHLGISYAVFCL